MKRQLKLFVSLALALVLFADTTPQTLSFSQDWTNTGLITADDNWSGVPGIIGYRGDAMTSATGVDPQTVVAEGGLVVDVNANQTSAAFNTGGVSEFQLTNPLIALKGSGTARAPHIVMTVNTTGHAGITVRYVLVDFDEVAGRSTTGPVALQYRVGTTGNYTNVPAGFVPNAVAAGTLVTVVSATLPAAADNQPVVQIRIITTDQPGTDQWIGIDNLGITGTPVSSTNPSGLGSANPSSTPQGGQTLLTVAVTPGSSPVSTGLTVAADLTPIGGSATQAFFDNGTNGDVTPGDNVFSYLATVSSGTTTGGKNLSFLVSDAQARSGSGSIPLTVTVSVLSLSINQIQGSGPLSPYNGASVLTEGIVTGRKSNGYFIQNPDGQTDADPNTSEGIFIFTSSAPPADAQVGNLVRVTGTVLEFRPSTDPNSPTLTEITSPTTLLLSTSNPLPGGVSIAVGDLNATGGVHVLERFESMRVSVASLTVVAPTDGFVSEANATSSTSGLFFGVITTTARPFREPGITVPNPPCDGGPTTIPCFDANPERLRVDSDALGAPALNVSSGVLLTGLVGILDYSNRNYTLLPDGSSTAAASPNGAFTPVPAPLATELTVGSINLERFFDMVNDPNTSDVVLTPTAFTNRLAKASLLIRNAMQSPDIVGVVEMENLATLQALAAKIAADGGPSYDAFLVEGNDLGGIDVGFLAKQGKVSVIDAQQEGKTATYINPNTNQPEELNDRPPLILRASVKAPGSDSGLPVTVIVNHLRSLNGVDGADGLRIRTKRAKQAEFLANIIQARQNDNVISVGDYNAFEFNDGYVDVIGTIKGDPTPAANVLTPSPDLVNPNLTNLMDTLSPSGRYSYVFDGSAQSLDHALVNQKFLSRVSRFAVAHANADFPETFRNDATRPERVSDHDGLVAYFRLPVEVTSKVRIGRTPPIFDAATNSWREAIAISNISGAPMARPLFIELGNLTAGVTITNAVATVDGKPIVASGTGTPIPAGGSVTIVVRYTRASGSGLIGFTPRVFSGSY